MKTIHPVPTALLIACGLTLAPTLASAQLLGGSLGGGGSGGMTSDLGRVNGAGNITGSGRVDSDLYGRTTDTVRDDADRLRRQGRDLADDARNAAKADVDVRESQNTRVDRNGVRSRNQAKVDTRVSADARPVTDDARAIARQGVRTVRNAADAATSSNVDVSASARGSASVDAN